MTTKQMKPKA